MAHLNKREPLVIERLSITSAERLLYPISSNAFMIAS